LNYSLLNSFSLQVFHYWLQQSTTAWIEISKEFIAYSQKVSELWSDAIWNLWTTKEDDQRRENMRLQNPTNHNIYKEKNKMRALILQGGGALGAFQAGAFKALYEKLTKEDKENGNEERLLFDIVAGTSIGAINAALLVSYVIENKNWKGSAEKLVEFWEYLSCPTPDITKASSGWKKQFDKTILVLPQQRLPEDIIQ
jgi:hypothetical protein